MDRGSADELSLYQMRSEVDHPTEAEFVAVISNGGGGGQAKVTSLYALVIGFVGGGRSASDEARNYRLATSAGVGRD